MIQAEYSTTVIAGPETIWELLANPTSWPSWWPQCMSATHAGQGAFREGSQFEIVLQPGIQKVTLRPVIDLLTENKTFSLTHRGLLMQATVVWYLEPTKHGIRVRVQVAVTGIGAFLTQIAQQSHGVHLAFKHNLRGLKRAAQRV